MGRLTNSNGLRLGLHLPWKDYHLAYSKKSLEFRELKVYIDYLCNDFALRGPLSGVLSFIVTNVRFVKVGKIDSVCIDLYEGAYIETGRFSKIAKYLMVCRLMSLEHLIQKACVRYGVLPCGLKINIIKKDQVTPELLCKYIEIKLYQGFTLMDIVFSLKKSLASTKGLKGYRIDFNGRFTRRQRTSFLSVKRGSVPFSKISAKVSYYCGSVTLKYGKCGFKIWVNKS